MTYNYFESTEPIGARFRKNLDKWWRKHSEDSEMTYYRLDDESKELFNLESKSLDAESIPSPELINIMHQLEIPVPGDRNRSVMTKHDPKFNDHFGEPIKAIDGRVSPHRAAIPNHRGINHAKVRKTLKSIGSSRGNIVMRKELLGFGTVDAVSEHMYYHGSANHVGVLRAGVSLPKNVTRGGGYDAMQHSISLTKSKRIASSFSGESMNVNIYNVLLKKDARVINVEGAVSDSTDLDEYIPELWDAKVDAAWIGGGEQELTVLNPRCIILGKSVSYQVFGMESNKITNDDTKAFIESYGLIVDESGAIHKPESALSESTDGESLDEPMLESEDTYIDTTIFDELKELYGDQFAGGVGDRRTPDEFDQEQLYMGVLVEIEHTDDPMIAMELAIDHLTEMPDYYIRLQEMEDEANGESITESMDDDYRGAHTAPTPQESPLYDVTLNGGYPDDIYSSMGYHYYGEGDVAMDKQSIAIIHQCRNKPNAVVTIYRAIPVDKKLKAKIRELKALVAYYVNYGFFPITDGTVKAYKEKYWTNGVGFDDDYGSKVRDDIRRDIDKLETSDTAIKINSGDWVTINRKYAMEHGEYALNGNYKILSKRVMAKCVFTDANSLHEFGYWDV